MVTTTGPANPYLLKTGGEIDLIYPQIPKLPPSGYFLNIPQTGLLYTLSIRVYMCSEVFNVHGWEVTSNFSIHHITPPIHYLHAITAFEFLRAIIEHPALLHT